MKKQLLPIIALFSISTAYAEEVNLQALQACTFVENDFNRLLCYDNIMAGKSLSKPSETKTLTPSGDVDSVAPTATPNAKKQTQSIKNTKDDFGLEHKKAVENNANELKATISEVRKAPYGELIISLDNGQQWRQIGSDRLRLSADDTVIIKRGTFNSFLLKKQGQNRSIRVKRTD